MRKSWNITIDQAEFEIPVLERKINSRLGQIQDLQLFNRWDRNRLRGLKRRVRQYKASKQNT